jgi:hypothetical protein
LYSGGRRRWGSWQRIINQLADQKHAIGHEPYTRRND